MMKRTLAPITSFGIYAGLAVALTSMTGCPTTTTNTRCQSVSVLVTNNSDDLRIDEFYFVPAAGPYQPNPGPNLLGGVSLYPGESILLQTPHTAYGDYYTYYEGARWVSDGPGGNIDGWLYLFAQPGGVFVDQGTYCEYPFWIN